MCAWPARPRPRLWAFPWANQPFFQGAGLIKRHGVEVFSANYALSGDLSARVMVLLARFTPDLKVCSLDEAFLDLT